MVKIKYLFTFVCGKDFLNRSRISVIPKDVIFQCIDVYRTNKYKS